MTKRMRKEKELPGAGTDTQRGGVGRAEEETDFFSILNSDFFWLIQETIDAPADGSVFRHALAIPSQNEFRSVSIRTRVGVNDSIIIRLRLREKSSTNCRRVEDLGMGRLKASRASKSSRTSDSEGMAMEILRAARAFAATKRRPTSTIDFEIFFMADGSHS